MAQASMPGRSLVIVNRNAAGVRDASTRRVLLDRLQAVLGRRDGVAPIIVETVDAASTRPVVQAGLGDGVRAVIGVGGDGTLRDIAGLLVNHDTPLGVIPGGTGNQLVAALGLPRSPLRAADALEHARPRSIDLGQVEIRHAAAPPQTSVFTIGCGVGFDARLMATTPAAWKRRFGSVAYFFQALRLATSVGSAPYRITIDGRLIETEASLALIGNMGQLVPGVLGPRMQIEPDDGQLDLLVVGANDAIDGLRGLADQLWRTSPGGESGSRSIRLRGRQISIQPGQPEALEVDGDYVGEGGLAALVLPAAIKVLVTAARTGAPVVGEARQARGGVADGRDGAGGSLMLESPPSTAMC
jgi:diacylglycerol kinase (ATP)